MANDFHGPVPSQMKYSSRFQLVVQFFLLAEMAELVGSTTSMKTPIGWSLPQINPNHNWKQPSAASAPVDLQSKPVIDRDITTFLTEQPGIPNKHGGFNEQITLW